MKILFVTPYPPNLVRVRPYNFVRYLSERGHHLTVATVFSNEVERADAERLRRFCSQVLAFPLPRWRSLANCLWALPSRTPLQAVYSWSPILSRHVSQLLDQERDGFDVIHVEHLRGSQYGLAVKRIRTKQRRAIPVVWDSVDCISLLFRLAAAKSNQGLRRWLMKFELGRTAGYEAHLLGQFDHTCVTSPLDKQALLELRGNHSTPKPISIVPNGVDLSYFRPDLDAPRQPMNLVVSGKMSYHANISMVLHLAKVIMPLVWQQYPEARLQVVGKDPSAEILALGKDPRIQVVGTVEDIRPYLQQASVALAPLTYGVGIQNKVLEAMACGTPVVCTSQAVSALQTKVGQDVIVADDPLHFAKAVCHLLQNPQERSQIGAAGRRYVEKYHDWANIAGSLEAIYLQSIRSS